MRNNSKLPLKLLETIENKANILKDYCLKSGQSIGYQTAKDNLTNWCNNFVGRIPDLKILIPVILNIKFIKDQAIFDRSMDEFHNEFSGDRSQKNVWLTPFGKKNESSFRIISRANKQDGFKDKLENVIRSVSFSDDSKDNVIVFIDDFLNTGGQFERILTFWEEKFSRKNEFVYPWKLTKEECYFRFYFISGMQTGQKRAQILFEKFGYKRAQVTIFEQYDDKKGIFGYPDDQQKIRNGNRLPVSDHMIFKNYKYCDIKPFFELCETVAKSFFEHKKAHWNEEKKLNRLLGYGNSAQLFLGQNNIPTPTLTAIWADCNVITHEGEFSWTPLFRRIEKKDVGVENGNPFVTLGKRSIKLGLTEDAKKIPFKLKIILHPTQTTELSIFQKIEYESQIEFFSNFHLYFIQFMQKEFKISSDLKVSRLIDSKNKLFQKLFNEHDKEIRLSNLFKIDYLGKTALCLNICFYSTETDFNRVMKVIFNVLDNAIAKNLNMYSGKHNNILSLHKIIVSTDQKSLNSPDDQVNHFANFIGRFFSYQREKIHKVKAEESFLYLNKNYTFLFTKGNSQKPEQRLENRLPVVDIMNLLLKCYMKSCEDKYAFIEKMRFLSNFIEASEIQKEYFKTVFKLEFL